MYEAHQVDNSLVKRQPIDKSKTKGQPLDVCLSFCGGEKILLT